MEIKGRTLNKHYQISTEDVLDHNTILWEGESLREAQTEFNKIKQVGPEGYEQMAMLELVTTDDDDNNIDYELIDEVVWYESVEEWEEANSDT